MDWGTATPVLAIVGALAAPFVAYRLAVRQMSGKVATSDAKDLWEESKSIREDYRAQLKEANERIDRVEEDNRQLQEENRKLFLVNAELTTKLLRLDRTVNGG